MPINSNVNYQQVLSLALEDRSRAWQDIVSNAIPLFAMMREKNMWESYSGPRIRQTLMFSLPGIQWYSGYDFLENPPEDRLNDAYFTPKMAAVPISLNMEEILNNEGRNQIRSVMKSYMEAAEKGLAEGMDLAMYSDGSANGGKQLGGLNVAVPESPTNVYGGINRTDYPIWATGEYDIASDFPDIGTTFDSTTAKAIYNRVMGQHTRGTTRPDIILSSSQHWEAYEAATVAIQRITRESSTVGKLGFRTLEYVGPGGSAELVWGGGKGTNMPDDTSFFLDSGTFSMRYNESRNFSKLFDGDGQKPINQDALAQFVGWMGEMTITNSVPNARLYTSA